MIDREPDLVEANLCIVHEVAARVSRRIPDADIDDLVGDGSIGLLSAIRSWSKADSGSLPAGWATTFVQRAMLDGVRAARGRRWRLLPCSLDRQIDDDGTTAIDLLVDEVADIEGIVAARMLTARILALEPRRRSVLVARGRGLTDAETGSFLGISSSRVREIALDAYSRFRRSLRPAR